MSEKKPPPNFTQEQLAAGWENRGELRELTRNQRDQSPNKANVEDHIPEVMRGDQKAALLKRGFSNALAESWLDRAGYSRPPGWHSVFFYPGSMRPRNGFVCWLIIITIAVWVLIR